MLIKINNNPETLKTLNKLAREELKLKILNDINIDMVICEHHQWDKKEYLLDLLDMIQLLLTNKPQK